MGPVSGGIDFVGFIVRPGYVLVRRRTLGNLKAKIQTMRRELVQTRMQSIFYRFDREAQQQHLAILNSYLGHLKHGRCHKAILNLWQANPFLELYFRFEHGKVIDRFKALKRGQLTLRRQVNLVHRLFKSHVCLIQVGCYFEIFGEHAPAMAEQLGLNLLHGWRGWQDACGFNQRRLPQVVKKCIDNKISIAIICQTGRESSFAKERLPALVIEPQSGVGLEPRQ